MYYLDGINKPRIKKSNFINEGYLYATPVTDLSSSGQKGNGFEISGLAIKFARLNKEKRIAEFANKYGMLGVGNGNDLAFLKNGDKFGFFSYVASLTLQENSYAESIDEWNWHINHVKKLLKLFNALKNQLDVNDILKIEKARIPKPIELKTIEIPRLSPDLEKLKASYITALDINRGIKPSKAIKQQKLSEYGIYWVADNEPTFLDYSEGFFKDEDIDVEFKKYAWFILHSHIFLFIREFIYLKFTSLKINVNAPINHSFVNIKATNYLIVAIYYDLFRIVNSNGNDRVNICSQCDRPFPSKRKDADTCGAACRKKKSLNKIDGGNNNA